MTNFYSATSALIFFAAMGGCSTSSGDNSGGGSSDATYAEQAALAADLQEEIFPLSATDPGFLRDTGSVSYAGVFSVVADQVVLLGDLSLTADFETDEVTGGLSNVNGTNGVDYGGSVLLTGGVIDRDASVSQTVTGDLAGEVSDGTNTVVFDTSINGDFFGDNEAYIGGDVTGDVTVDDVTTTLGDGDGAFAVSSEE